ncbi:hypothetical protein [Runella sp.]|uniref:hypothetical protein n=1 Tax=Runella sp. TaxID=1960881 RepID=UPI003D0F0397
MKKHPIDKLFAQKLKEAEIKPRDESWEKLQLRMQQNKKRRIGGWWQQGPWLAAAGVCLLLVAGWLMWRSNNTASETNLAQHPEKKKAIEQSITPKKEVEVKEEIKAPIVEQVAANVDEQTPEAIGKVTPPKNTKSAATTLKSGSTTPQPMVAKLAEEQKPETPMKQEKLPVSIEQNTQTIAQATTQAQAESKASTKTVVLQLPEIKETLVAANVKEVGAEPTVRSEENKEDSDEFDDNLLNKPRKSTRMAKVWKQLKNAKNGERVDWDEVGFNPNKMLAKATGKEKERNN